MARPRIVFFYLLVPAIFVIFVYSFIFAGFSNLSHLHPVTVTTNDALHTVAVVDEVVGAESGDSFAVGVASNGTLINTLDGYLQLDLNPNDTNFWSPKLEQQYNRTLSQNQFPLKVIIVPHSHNDPGWLNTYDQYFYRYTYYILENMVKNLNKYPNMTFIWAEMSFFSRWWDGLTTEAARQKVKNLLQGKRFEIVTGGWVMTDEASASYPDMLEQLIEGHQFLRSTLNYTPSNSWSVDPFGHSATMPYLLQKSGLSNMYIQRTHFAWKRRLAETRSLEFFWRQFFQQQSKDSSSSRKQQSMMCHMSPLDLYSYKYACGPDYKTCLDFDFRKIFGESSESTAVELNSTNIEAKANEILEQYGKLGSLFRHNVALVLLGDDFRYDLDTEWRQQYDNYQRLMRYVNGHSAKFKGANIQFGTLQDYFEEVNSRLPLDPKTDAYPSLVGDFMPYADVYVSGVPNYWTGYYSTRPFFKQMSRQLQHWLRTGEIVYSLARHRLRTSFNSSLGSLSASIGSLLERYYSSHLTDARQNLSLFQHHDGITGTSRDYVMEDYARRMAHSIGKLMELTALSVQLLNAQSIKTSANFSKPFLFAQQHKPSWSRLADRRLLRVPAGESGLKLVLFNSNLQKRSETVRILVEDPFVKVIDVEDGRRVSVQVNPVYNGRQLSSNTFELEFAATLYPLSLKNYKVLTNEESIQAKVTIVTVDNGANGSRSDGHEAKKKQNNDNNNNSSSDSNNNNNNGDEGNPVTSRTTSNEVFHFEASTPSSSTPLYLENDLMRIDLNKGGFMERLHHKASNTVEQVEMHFAAYHSKPTQSGAYLFKPVNRVPERLFSSVSPRMTLLKGPLSSTLLVNYSDIAYSLTLHNSSGPTGAAVELKVLLDLGNAYNDREVVLQIGCKSIVNQLGKNVGGTTAQYRSFYVDSNGFTILQRNFAPESGVEGNYYPMTTTAYIEDGHRRLSLLTSSSHGVTSPADGTLEVMLDRRILEDDKRGLSQGVTDNLPVELSFWLLLERRTTPARARDEPTGQLSALADALLLQLNYPSVVLYSYKSDREVAREHGLNYFVNQYFIAPNLLCEYFLLNLRTMPLADDFSHPSNSSLLLLHNRASASSTERQWQPMLPLSQHCDNSSAVLAKQGLHLFNGLRVAKLEESTLTGLKALHQIESLAQVQVAPGEIDAYTVHFY